MKMRLDFKCWNDKCGRDYSLFLEVEGQPKLTVECPYCGTEGIADLDPYRQENDQVFKSVTGDRKSIGTQLKIPKVIPTTEPEN
ncbi:MAG: hypothetical protein GY869_20060, partial [Planctomycetes bacterium]|nr:hypothetical protein [Planctomycetota bacterium]